MKKRIFTTFLAALIVFAMSPSIIEAEAARDITVYIDGQPVYFPDQKPIIVNGRILVPVRDVFEALGFVVNWDLETFSVLITWPYYCLHQVLPPVPTVELRPVIPRGGYLEHFIEPGQSLASIAQIYWPHNPETPSGRLVRDELIAHLAVTNNIANPELIFAGTWLRIYEHPQIPQPFELRYP